jgi:type IV pilus assembly protein PilW
MSVLILSSAPRTRGFTLVELLIATGLMGLLSGLAIQVYTTQTAVYRQQQASVFLQQQALVANDALRQALMEAAPTHAGPQSRSIALASPVAGTQWQSRDHRLFDSLVILQQQGSDCSGSPLDASPVRWKMFSVRQGELQCRDSDGQTLALVSGVEAFQVRYGMDWHGQGYPAQYVPAAQAALAEHRVVAVRVGLLLKSDTPVLHAQQGLPDDTRLLDQELSALVPEAAASQSDRHLRKLTEMTFALRQGKLR